MAHIALAVGIDTRGNPVNLCTGENFIAPQAALDAAGQTGTVDIGYVSSKIRRRCHSSLRAGLDIKTDVSPERWFPDRERLVDQHARV